MRKLIILSILCFLSVFVKGQVYQLMPQYGYDAKRLNIDSTLSIPSFCGVPSLLSNKTKKAAIAYDSCNARFYYYNPKTLVWDFIKSVDTTSLSNRIDQRVKYSDTASMLLPYAKENEVALKLNISDTSGMLSVYLRKIDTFNLSNRIDQRVKYSDTSSMLNTYFNNVNYGLTKSGQIISIDSATLSLKYLRITDTTNKWVTSIYRKIASDSVFYVKNGSGIFAYKDSVAAGTTGGSSVSLFLNGGTSQGTILGNTYYQMSNVAVVGSAVNFTRTNAQGNGIIAEFITDVNQPNRLEIPAGNWNLQFYFSASSLGGTPSFYTELYKYNGSTFTLLSTNSSTPEVITGGTSVDLYLTNLAVPLTTLLSTDRLAVRIYVITSGRTITMYTQDSHLCEIVTTFSNGITALNGLVNSTQLFATGTSGTDFNISSLVDTHTFNIPTASATNRGLLSSTDWTTFNNKLNISDTSNKWITNVYRKTASDSVFYVKGGTNTFAFKDSTGGGSNIYTTDGSLTSARTLTLNSQPLTFAGTTSSRFFANGNVGIGTTTDAGYKLDVQGSSFFLNDIKLGSGNKTISSTASGTVNATFGSSGILYGEWSVIPNSTKGFFIGNSYGLANSKSILELSSTTQGFLQPRMTTTQMNAIASPPTGLSVFNTTDSANYTYRGTKYAWQKNVVYNRDNDVALFNGANQRIVIDTTTNVVAGRSLTVEAGSTQSGGTSAFQPLSQTSRDWYFITVAPNGDVFACVVAGSIYKQTAGTGNFVSLGITNRNWQGIAAAPNGDIYATVGNGDIYKSTNNGTSFTALGQSSLNWQGITVASNGDIYAVAYGGDIYKSTNAGTTFTGLGQTSRNWVGIAIAINGDIYATVYGGDIYKSTGGGTFTALGQSSKNWVGIAAASNGDIYAVVYIGDFWKITNNGVTFTALGQTQRNWRGIAFNSNGDIYATVAGGDIYLQSAGTINLNGGTLTLQSGVGKGTGTSTINFNTGTTLTTGTTLQTASTKMTILGSGRVGIGTTTPASILDVTSTTSGFLPPRMTTTQRNAITSPAEGTIVYDLTLHKLYIFTGTVWEQITSL